MAWGLILGVTTVVIAHATGARLVWPKLKQLDQTLMLFMVLALIGSVDVLPHPFSHGSWIAWLIAYVTFYGLLKRNDQENLNLLQQLLHGAGIWVAAILVTWDCYWWIQQWLSRPGSIWAFTVWVLIPSTVFTVIHLLTSKVRWPFKLHTTQYIGLVSIPVVIFSAMAVVVGSLTQPGHPAPLPYFPLLNPLDLVNIFALVLIFNWWVRIQPEKQRILPNLKPKQFFAGMAIIAFIVINSSLIKTIHHWYHVPLDFGIMMTSDLTQTSLTLLWSILAMLGMMVSSKRKWRYAWIVGGGLLSVVVVKLFLVDLANVGTVERIVSFMFVGGLMLVIGYFTPLPPKEQEQKRA